jgi:hypothetical protein
MNPNAKYKVDSALDYTYHVNEMDIYLLFSKDRKKSKIAYLK